MSTHRTASRARASSGHRRATLRHARYIISDNPVTGLAFGLFVIIVLLALFGPYIVPYDPLASNTAFALKPPSAAHWFGTDQLGRDVFSRVIVATRLDFIIAVCSVALVFVMGGLSGVAAGFFGGWTDRIVGRIADTIMAFPLFVLAMGIVAALGNTVENIVLATAIVNFPLYARVARAEANVRREAGFVQAARLCGNGEFRILLDADPAQHHADHDRADVAHHGLRHPQRRRPVVHRARRAAADGGVGDHGRRRRGLHGVRRMVDRVLPRPRADGRGVLLQPPGRWPARHRRPAAAHMSIPNTIPLLDVRDLTVEFQTRRGIVRAVQNVDVTVAKGETVGIVGESGSGKSVTSYAVMRILDRAGRIADGSVMFSGVDVRAADEHAMRDLRGREMSMIFQNPRAALNPIRKVGRQIEDVLLQHVQATPAEATEKAVEILEQVRIARPRERYHAYPFELSGGMCQRVVIALALACRPQLLIADEPTTGLDVTTQKTVMDLVDRADAPARHVDHPDHPRSRSCRGLLRPRGGDAEGQRGRDRGIADDLHRAVASLYAQADAGDAAARRVAARSAAGGRDAAGASRRRRTSSTARPASRCWWSRS